MSVEPESHRGQLRRADKIMTTQEIDAFLAAAFCGRTATVGRDGYPYVVPNLFVWHDRTVYLHTARAPGHFIDNVRHCDRASFEADEPGEVFPYGHVECDTSVSYRSVVLFGRIRIIESAEEAAAFFRRFMGKYAPAGSWGREIGSFPRIPATFVYAIDPEKVTGKQGHLPGIENRWPRKNNTLSPEWRPGPSALPK
ncbi:MAG TPA: pyridoxamine 5'-phosphate oxidase family protein [Steroidobacteraceae bacterium]|nr:pyridoxamine 5'-phosphate oxidase family protein [Steroidobacteraceae bacterium]